MCFPNNYCDLDPLPDVLLRVCIDLLFGTPINSIIVSLKTGIFPDDFKQAHEKPLIKMITLPKDSLKKFLISASFPRYMKRVSKIPMISY